MSKIDRTRFYEAEANAVVNAQFAALDRMKELKLSKTQLAKLMGVSTARIAQLFSDEIEPNPTIKTLARMAVAMDVELSVQFKPQD